MDYYQIAIIILIIIGVLIFLNSFDSIERKVDGFKVDGFKVDGFNIEGFSEFINDEGIRNIASIYNNQNMHIDTLNITGTFSHVPKGTIVIWNGTSNNIPTGWVICDGKNGTPNLIGRYPIASTGSGTLQNKMINASGITNEIGNHVHTTGTSTNSPLYYIALCCKPESTARAPSVSTSEGGNHSHTVTINKLNSIQLNKFNALFIMKV